MAKILLVEDDSTMAMMIRDILESSGVHQVASAGDGIAGLQFLGVEPRPEIKAKLGEADWKFIKNGWTPDGAQIVLPELVLSDCMMPRMDGLMFVTEMSVNERVQKIPVIVLTTKLKMEKPFLKIPNVAGFIAKPANPDRLLAVAAEVLAKN